MQYTLKGIKFTGNLTNMDFRRSTELKHIAAKYNTVAGERVYESITAVQDYIQNFVEDCNATYSVDRVAVSRSNSGLELRMTLDPFTNTPCKVVVSFDAVLLNELQADAKVLEKALY